MESVCCELVRVQVGKNSSDSNGHNSGCNQEFEVVRNLKDFVVVVTTKSIDGDLPDTQSSNRIGYKLNYRNATKISQ